MSASSEVVPNTLDSMSDAVAEPADVLSTWRLASFAESLTSLSENTVTAYVGDVRGFAEWAGRAGVTDPSGGQANHHPSLPGVPDHPPVRPPEHRSQDRLPAPLLPMVATPAADLDRSDARRAYRRRATARLPRVLDQRDISELLERPGPQGEAVWRRAMDDAVLELLYGSGLRVSELCGLDTSSLDLDAAAVVVWGKGSKQRRVPLSEPSVVALRTWLGIRHEVVPVDGHGAVRPVRQRARAPPHASRRPPHRRSAVAGADASSCTAPQLRHPSARRGCRSASGAGTAGAPRRGDDAALHARQSRATARRLQLGTPSGVSGPT